ncbi:hypothetical protein LCGC14_0946210 [marine sediment metagenome]|uniref:Uncharacterized protein n=1 Tax=marine sediment metagenome TaxID=412755 RepID=A0A0F9NIR8_9ZZZZ
MAKCEICGKDSGKGRTCGSTCRSKLARSVAKATVTDATVISATPVDATVDDGLKGAKVLPDNYGLEDCQCRHCQNNRAKGNKHVLNHGKWKPIEELGANELNRVSLPGDVDYTGVCLDSKYDSHRIGDKVSVPAVSGRTV